MSSTGTTRLPGKSPPTESELHESSISLLRSELNLVTQERDTLRLQLMLRPAETADPLTISPRMDRQSFHDYDSLRAQCEKVMSELHSLKTKTVETTRKCENAVKESDYFRSKHRTALQDIQQLQSDIFDLRSRLNAVTTEKQQLDLEVSSAQRSRDAEHRELLELRQIYRENQMYDPEERMSELAAMERDKLQEEYDALVNKFSQNLDSHASTMKKYELAEKENVRLKRASEEAMSEKNRAIADRNSFKQQLNSMMKKRDSVLVERDVAVQNWNQIHQLHEQLLLELNQTKLSKAKYEKDLKRVADERNSFRQEYTQVMSERGVVHQEINELQEKLSATLKQVATIETEKKAALNELETLRREITSALNDRDKAIKECYDLREKLGNLEKDAQKNSENERYAVEMDTLQQQVNKWQNDVTEAQREAEIFKSRRDWAFRERDKIMHERDSMKILCDKLRKDRDNALCDLAEARRDGDEMKKQCSQVMKETQDLRDRVEQRSYRDTRVRQLHSRQHNDSRDSAIDTEFSGDVLSETLEVDLSAEPSKLGFDLSGGMDDPACPTAIYVSHVLKGSPAEGKLQVSDFVLRMNNVDLVNADKKTALQVLHSSSGILNLLIRRRKSVKLVPKYLSFHFQIPPPSELGLTVARGLFVSHLGSSSPLKEAGLYVGDRISHLAGESVDEKTPEDICNLFQNYESHLVRMNVVRYFANSPLSGGSMNYGSDTSDSEKNSHGHSISVGNPESPVHAFHAGLDVGVQTEGDFVRNDSTLRQKRPSESKDKIVWKSLFEAKDRVRPRLDNVFPIDLKSHTTVKTARTSSGKEAKTSLLDKIFRRERKEPRPTIEVIPITAEETNALAALESVVKHYTSPYGTRFYTKRKVESHSEKLPSGTWPKYKGPPLKDPIQVDIKKPSPKDANRKSTNSLTLNMRNTPWVCTDISIDDDDAVVPSPSPSVKTLKSNRSNRNYRLSVPPIFDSHIYSPPTPAKQRPLTVYPENTDNDSSSLSSSLDFIDTSRLTTDQGRPVNHIFQKRPYREPASPPSSYSQVSGVPPVVAPSGANGSIYGAIRSRVSAAIVPSNNVFRGADPSGIYGTLDPTKRPNSLRFFDENYWAENVYSSPRSRPANQRIYVPTNPSMSSKSSLSHMSTVSGSMDCGSPVLTGSPLERGAPPLYQTIRKRPQIGQVRSLHLEFHNEQPGFKIRGQNREVFVSTVMESSIADKAGLVVGDQILDVCGINLRAATYEEAKTVLLGAGSAITMQVQYRGTYVSPTGSSGFLQSPVSSATTSSDSLRGPTGTLRGTSRPSTDSVKSSSGTEQPSRPHEARFVKLSKGFNEPLGINLIGGNVHGIFIHSVQSDSVATGPNGLCCGDQILEYNSVNMRTLLLEKAMDELCKPVQNVCVIVQYNPAKYELAKSTAGDSLFVRALWDRDKSQLQDEDLMFTKGEILFIDNTLYNGKMGSWRAWLVGENAEKTGDCGIVPNRYNAEEEVLRIQQPNSDSMESDSNHHRRSARRSFFKRRKIQNPNGRELASFTSSSLGNENCFSVAPEEPLIPTYQRVEKLIYEQMRPVLIAGPLADVLVERLLQNYRDRFARCPTQTSTESPSFEDSEVIEVRQFSGFWETVAVKSIREVAEKGQHCLLDVSITSVDRMQTLNIQPIVLVIKFRSSNVIREVRDGGFSSAKISHKAAKELFELASRMEAENGRMITAIIPGGTSLSYMASLAYKAIEEAQTKPQWVPAGPFS